MSPAASTLSDTIDSLVRVLRYYGMSASQVDQVARAVASARDAESVVDALEARPLHHAAWIARMNGFVRETESGYLLTGGPDAPTVEYEPEEGALGGAIEERADGKEAWRYGRLDGRALIVRSGDKVKLGDLLTDGPVDSHDMLRIRGRTRALSAAAQRLAVACGLDPETAERVGSRCSGPSTSRPPR